jgi:hypothetical protein
MTARAIRPAIGALRAHPRCPYSGLSLVFEEPTRDEGDFQTAGISASFKTDTNAARVATRSSPASTGLRGGMLFGIAASLQRLAGLPPGLLLGLLRWELL